ncbi:MAG: Holliday junction branch migration protein RuvA [Parcubacteria group bacterium]|nr:Holliday junction branch migration protein RuvA [Parcubacteria group bacterium]
MIAQLRGEIGDISGNTIVLLVGGVGYRVNTTLETVQKIKESDTSNITLKTYLAVRETSLDLYGFLENEELSFFEMLLSVSGIGPKSALSILNVADVETLKTAVSTGESSYLTKVSGIGKKNAEKIIIELRDKLGAIASKADNTNMKEEMETFEALQTLGYSTREAREAMKNISKEANTPSERIKEVLKILGKQE